VNWNGYQPPLTSINPAKLIDDKFVPEQLTGAIVTEEMFTTDLTPTEIPPEQDALWIAAWEEIKAGA
jgi:hypothetical protein